MSVLPADRVTDLSIAADAAHAVNPWVALAYLAAGVLFILALRGLSSPATSQRGNRFGMAGMLIAVDDKEPYDRFRDRLTMPIHDARGRVIGRTCGSAPP